MAKYKKKKLEQTADNYLILLERMSNFELFNEYSFYNAGDDHDGERTTLGQWKYEAILIELEKRLKNCGFLESNQELHDINDVR